MIKAAQEKEELQRYGDELDGKVKKCEKEIKALLNTLDHLKVRNRNYRDKFMQGAEGADLERKQILEDQFRSASEALFRKRRDMGQLEQNFKTASLELIEVRNQKQEVDRQANEQNQLQQQYQQELEDIGGIHAHPPTAGNQRLVGTQPLTREILPALEPDQSGLMSGTP